MYYLPSRLIKSNNNNINNIDLLLLHKEIHSFASISKYFVEHVKQEYKSQS